MVSGCLAGGVEGSVASSFELGGWHVAEVSVETFGVVPVHPAERRELDFLDRLPRSLPGPADQLGLVEPVDRLGERVVDESPTDPIEGTRPSSASRSP